MPASRLPWIKLWPECMGHEKVALLADGEYRTWTYCLMAGAQQKVRWRFASVEHAAVVTGRPAEHVARLVEAGLLDAAADGLWVHDWRDWQQVYASDLPRNRPARTGPPVPEGSDIKEGRLRERSAKTPRRLREDSAEKGDGRREKGDVNEGVAATRSPRPTPTARAPDLIFDAFVAIFGAPLTATERAKFNAAAKLVRDGARGESQGHAEAAMAVGLAHEHWANVMGSATETPMAIANNLGLLLTSPQVEGRRDGHVAGRKRGVAALAETAKRRLAVYEYRYAGERALLSGAACPPAGELPADGR